MPSEGVCGLGILLLCSAIGIAAEPEPQAAPSGFTWQTWTREHGIPMGRIQTILQTGDGYVWVGTSAGVARFDGRHWVVFNRANTPGLPGESCSSLVEDTDGQLWGHFKDRLVQWDGSTFKDFDWPNPGEHKPIWNICASRSGGLWVIAEPGLWLVRGNDRRLFPLVEATGQTSLGDVGVTCLQETEAGLWIGRSRGLTLFDPRTEKFIHDQGTDGTDHPQFVIGVNSDDGGTQRVLHVRGNPFEGWLSRFDNGGWRTNDAANANNNDRVMSLFRDRRGVLWLPYGTGRISKIRAGSRWDVPLPPTAADDYVLVLGDDREGGLWLGTEGNRLLRAQTTKVDAITMRHGLGTEAAWVTFQASDGAIWVGSDGGAHRFNDGKAWHYTEREGLSRNTVRAIAEDADGRIWIGTGSGLNWIDPRTGRVHQYRFPGDWHNSKIRALVTDRNHLLWVATAGGLYCLALQRPSMGDPVKLQAIYNGESGLPHEDVRTLLEDRAGSLWVGTFGGGVYRFHDGHLDHYALTNQFSGESAWVLHEDDRGAIWVGTEHGLARLKDGCWRAFSVRDGLPEDSINHIVSDNVGRLWLGGELGIYRLVKKELDDIADGRAAMAHCVEYDHDEGLVSRETNGQKNQPGAIRARDGRLYFSTTKGVVIIDPQHLPDQTNPPPVVIEQVRASGETIFNNKPDAEAARPLRGEAALRPGSGRVLEFHYTANTFVAADKVRFKYRLHGFDPEWIRAGTRRVAQYANLAPGQYRFQVLAANKYGIWNETGATFAFSVAPFFWQTTWCKTVLIGTPLLAGYGYYRRRMGEHRRRAEAERRLAVFTERADIARDLHDHLGARLTLVQHLTQALDQTPLTHGNGNGSVPRQKLRELARELNASLDGAVWAVQPDKDVLASLADYLGDSFQELLATTEIELELEFPHAIPAWPLSRAERYHLALIAIEALNNVLKHARATAVRLRLQVCDHGFELSIIDDGCGFEAARYGESSRGVIAGGHGLANMRQRIEQLGGRFELTSALGQGTAVTISLVPAGLRERKETS